MRLLILLIIFLFTNKLQSQNTYDLKDTLGLYIISIKVQSSPISEECKISGKVYYDGRRLFQKKRMIRNRRGRNFYRMEWLSNSIGRRFKVYYYPLLKKIIFKEGVKSNGLWPYIDNVLKTSYLEKQSQNPYIKYRWEGKRVIRGKGYKFEIEVNDKILQLNAAIKIDTFSCNANGSINLNELERNVLKPLTIFKENGLKLYALYKGGSRLRIRAYWKYGELTFKKKGKLKHWTIYIDKYGNLKEHIWGKRDFGTILKKFQNEHGVINLNQQYGIWKGKAKNIKLVKNLDKSKVDIVFSLTLNTNNTYQINFEYAQIDPKSPVKLTKELWTKFIKYNNIQFQNYNIIKDKDGALLQFSFISNTMKGREIIKEKLKNIEILKLTDKILKIRALNQVILLKRQDNP